MLEVNLIFILILFFSTQTLIKTYVTFKYIYSCLCCKLCSTSHSSYRTYLYQTHCPCGSCPCHVVRPPVDPVHWQIDRPVPVHHKFCPTDRFPCHVARPWECCRRQFPLQEVRIEWVSERQAERLRRFTISSIAYIAVYCIFRVIRSNYKPFYCQPP